MFGQWLECIAVTFDRHQDRRRPLRAEHQLPLSTQLRLRFLPLAFTPKGVVGASFDVMGPNPGLWQDCEQLANKLLIASLYVNQS